MSAFAEKLDEAKLKPQGQQPRVIPDILAKLDADDHAALMRALTDWDGTQYRVSAATLRTLLAADGHSISESAINNHRRRLRSQDAIGRM